MVHVKARGETDDGDSSCQRFPALLSSVWLFLWASRDCTKQSRSALLCSALQCSVIRHMSLSLTPAGTPLSAVNLLTPPSSSSVTFREGFLFIWNDRFHFQVCVCSNWLVHTGAHIFQHLLPGFVSRKISEKSWLIYLWSWIKGINDKLLHGPLVSFMDLFSSVFVLSPSSRLFPSTQCMMVYAHCWV